MGALRFWPGKEKYRKKGIKEKTRWPGAYVS